MVNNQTSQNELLNKNKNYLSCLGIFPYVRVILQYSIPLDHPVYLLSYTTTKLSTLNKQKIQLLYFLAAKMSR